jgi:hypothetical protein
MSLVHAFVNKTPTRTCPLFKEEFNPYLLPGAWYNKSRYSALPAQLTEIKLVIRIITSHFWRRDGSFNLPKVVLKRSVRNFLNQYKWECFDLKFFVDDQIAVKKYIIFIFLGIDTRSRTARRMVSSEFNENFWN